MKFESKSSNSASAEFEDLVTLYAISKSDLSTYLCTTSGPICSFCTIFLKPQRDCSKMHFATIPMMQNYGVLRSQNDWNFAATPCRGGRPRPPEMTYKPYGGTAQPLSQRC